MGGQKMKRIKRYNNEYTKVGLEEYELENLPLSATMNLDIVLFISLNSLRIKKYTFQTQEKIGSFSFSSPNDHQELIGTDLGEKKNLLNTFLKLDLSKTPMNSSRKSLEY